MQIFSNDINGKSLPFISWCVPGILFVPAFGDLLRKFFPGQPNWVVPLFGSAAITMAFLWLLSKPSRLRLPAIFAEPLAVWFIFASLYSVPGNFVDWRIGPATFLFRLLPMFLSLFAYKAIQKPEDFFTLIRPLTFLPIILLPFGIISMINGNHSLPHFLQPTMQIQKEGRDFRVGFDMCSTIFCTAPIMANSLCALFTLTIAGLSMPERLYGRFDKIIFIISIIADLILVYASTRRGDFFVLIGGLSYFMYLTKRFRPQMFAAIIAGLLILFFLDNHSTAKTERFFQKRSDFMFSNKDEINDRINDIFLGSVSYWADKNPFGSYYGKAGMETTLFAPSFSVTESVETGGAQLVADTGIIGAILMPLMLIIVWVRLWSRSKKSEFGKPIRLILFGAIGLYILYYCKVVSALSSLYMAQLFFWMAPGISFALCRKKTSSIESVS